MESYLPASDTKASPVVHSVILPNLFQIDLLVYKKSHQKKTKTNWQLPLLFFFFLMTFLGFYFNLK